MQTILTCFSYATQKDSIHIASVDKRKTLNKRNDLTTQWLHYLNEYLKIIVIMDENFDKILKKLCMQYNIFIL